MLGKLDKPPHAEWNWTLILHDAQKLTQINWHEPLSMILMGGKKTRKKLFDIGFVHNFFLDVTPVYGHSTLNTLDLAWIWHQKHKQQKQKLISESTSN